MKRDWLGVPRELWQGIAVILGFLALDVLIVYLNRGTP